jgi:hypothetical protein
MPSTFPTPSSPPIAVVVRRGRSRRGRLETVDPAADCILACRACSAPSSTTRASEILYIESPRASAPQAPSRPQLIIPVVAASAASSASPSCMLPRQLPHRQARLRRLSLLVIRAKHDVFLLCPRGQVLQLRIPAPRSSASRELLHTRSSGGATLPRLVAGHACPHPRPFPSHAPAAAPCRLARVVVSVLLKPRSTTAFLFSFVRVQLSLSSC